MTDFESYINEHGKLIYTNVGVSMLPLLRQGKDLFVITVKKGRCKVGDVVLYRRKYQHVLHRIIAMNENNYVILGDNCIEKEYDIKDSDIVGIMTYFIRNGKVHSVDETCYRLYSFVWLKTSAIRIFIKKTLLFMRKLLKHE